MSSGEYKSYKKLQEKFNVIWNCEKCTVKLTNYNSDTNWQKECKNLIQFLCDQHKKKNKQLQELWHEHQKENKKGNKFL